MTEDKVTFRVKLQKYEGPDRDNAKDVAVWSVLTEDKYPITDDKVLELIQKALYYMKQAIAEGIAFDAHLSRYWDYCSDTPEPRITLTIKLDNPNSKSFRILKKGRI